jgi:hypothetical protein
MNGNQQGVRPRVHARARFAGRSSNGVGLSLGVLVGHATKGGGSHGLGLGLEAGAQLPEFDGFTVGLSTLTFTSDSSTRTRDFQTLVMVDGRFHVESFDRGLSGSGSSWAPVSTPVRCEIPPIRAQLEMSPSSIREPLTWIVA